MNFSDLASNLVSIESEERKESEFQWIWKEIAQPQDVVMQPAKEEAQITPTINYLFERKDA
jgi:hypothetical protein